MSSDTVPNISIIVSGKAKSLVLEMLTKVEGIHLNIICSNLLDYELETEKFQPIKLFPWELVTVLKQTTDNVKEAFPIPSKIKEELLSNLSSESLFEEEDLHILYNINQIESVSKNIDNAYEVLEGQIGKENINIFPISDLNPNLIAVKQKRWSPLRYYSETGELLFDLTKLNGDDGKKKKGNKNLEIDGLERLESIKLNERVKTILEDSDLVVFLPTDVLSLEVFLRSKSLSQQVKKLSPLNKSVILWNPTLISGIPERDNELSTLLGFEDFENFDDYFADIFDYVVIDKDATEEELQRLYDGEIKVIREVIPLFGETYKDFGVISRNLIESLFNIANIELDGKLEIENAKDENNSPKTTISIDEIREEENENTTKLKLAEESPKPKVKEVDEPVTEEHKTKEEVEPEDVTYKPPKDLSFEHSIKATID